MTQNPSDVFDELSKVSSLPSPPRVAVRILEVTRDPEKGTRDLAEVLQTDAALTTKILQIANSAAYARSGETETVTDAVNLLGAKSVSLLALGFSLRQEMQGGSVGGLSHDTLWRHSIATAAVARAVGRYVMRGQAEVCFLCGLLSRVGQLIAISALTERYSEVVSSSTSAVPSAEEEIAIMGVSHHQIADFLLDTWQLPEVISQTIVTWGNLSEEDSDETVSEDVVKLAQTVRFADAARGVLFEEQKGGCLNSLYDMAHDYWNLTDAEVDRIFLACQKELQDTLRIFDKEADVNFSCDELLDMARNQMVQTSMELVSDLSTTKNYCEDLENTNRELELQSTTDALTGLRNRHALDIELAKINEANASGPARTYSVVMLDIDKFKSLNDNFGHDYGDEVLREVGKALKECARATDFIARYGGEEFMVVLPNCMESDALEVAERFRSSVSDRHIELPDGSRIVTASAGVATSHGDPYEITVKRADTALYKAKEAGRDRTMQYRADSKQPPAPSISTDGSTVNSVTTPT